MSRRTLGQLPLHIKLAISAYEKEVLKDVTVPSPEIRRFLRHTSDYYRRFSNYKLLRSSTFNREDFAPLVARSISPLFEKPLDIGLDSLPTEELFKQKRESIDESLTESSSIESKKSSTESTKSSSTESTKSSTTASSTTSSSSTSSSSTTSAKSVVPTGSPPTTPASSPSTTFSYPSITSRKLRTTSRTTDYTANVITTLHSHYVPRSAVPNVPALQNVHKWFMRLLRHTPVVFVLKERQQLFSDASLAQINQPWIDLKKKVYELSKSFGTEDRTYHATELTYVDLLRLAESQEGMKETEVIKEKIELKEEVDVREGIELKESQENDQKHLIRSLCPLSQCVADHQDIFYTDENGNVVPTEEVEDFVKGDYGMLLKKVNRNSVHDVFPFDVNYNEFFLVTIEEPLVAQDHTALMKVLRESGMELVAARMLLSNPHIAEFFHEDLRQPVGYEGMLESAKRSRQPMAKLMTELASQGLVKVKPGNNSVCLVGETRKDENE